MQKTYGDRVQFVTIYTKEAHPVDDNPSQFSHDLSGKPINQPMTYEERVANAVKVVKEAGITMPVLVDEIDNPLWCTYGRLPNVAFLIGKNGRIVARQDWNDANGMEHAIKDYLLTHK